MKYNLYENKHDDINNTHNSILIFLFPFGGYLLGL